MSKEFEEFAGKMVYTVSLALHEADEHARLKGDLDEARNRPLEGPWKLAGVEADGLTFKNQYNDACGCHPEMTTVETFMPWVVVEGIILGMDWRSPIAVEGTRLRKIREQAEAARQKGIEARAIAAREKADRKQLEALKAKYEPTVQS